MVVMAVVVATAGMISVTVAVSVRPPPSVAVRETARVCPEWNPDKLDDTNRSPVLEIPK